MKTYGESRSIAPPYLTLALGGIELSASQPGRFTPGERAPGTELNGSRSGHCKQKKNLSMPGI
jgi:hypothetical protein